MRKGFVLVLGLLLSASAAVAPTAGAGDDEFEKRFRAADRDSDGALSRDEAQRAGWFVGDVERFDGIDRDRSGTVTLFELGEALADRMRDWMSADTDRDGRVTEAETQAQPASFREMFHRADGDGDRVVTREEFEHFSQRSYYRHTDLPSVVPNIFEKRF